MEINELKDQIQNQALEVWKTTGKESTCEIITGLGKTFLALKALYTMPRNDQDTVHLFLAEQKDRELDLKKDIEKFNKIYKCDVFADYNLQFYCYQTVRKWEGYKIGLVIADEIHDSITPEYFKFYVNNEIDAVLGLTALFNGEQVYTLKKEAVIRQYFRKDLVTKAELLEYIAPIRFKYNVNQGQTEGTSRKLNIYIVETELNAVDKTIEAGSANSKFMQSEKAAYSYVERLYNNAANLTQGLLEDFYKFQEKKKIQMYLVINRRCKLLYNLPSKIYNTNTILSVLDGKTIIFGNSIESLKKITNNVVSSKNTDTENNKLREFFDKNLITVIGSFKKLVQGANLEKVDNCIIMSYYSTEHKFIQMIGRLRQNKDLSGNVFVLVTKDTQEEIWVAKMIENAVEYNMFRGKLQECLDKYKEDNDKL